MKEQSDEAEESNGQENQNKNSNKEKKEQESKTNEQKVMDALLGNGAIQKILSYVPSFLLGAASGFGVSYYFSDKREEKAKKENDELKQSLTEMQKECKKLKKKQRKLKDQHEGEDHHQSDYSTVNGMEDNSGKKNQPNRPGSIRNAYLD